ncbi:choice-of-anchor M domain-containing protein [Brevibacterium album]|uniref:choice-of-anchor M domain-containing protein n=1 Tax=Brevibacterium album TaxID=417948 RepID=UPI0004159A1C|nr:choice-of-anchor M domain-containing protein [Brevibacterium album]
MRLLSRQGTAALAASVLAIGSALAAPTIASAADHEVLNDPVVFGEGHVDAFNMLLNDDGSVELALREDVTGQHVLHSPESVDLVVKETAQQAFSASDRVPEELQGQEVYHLPERNTGTLIWPGWDTMSLTPEFGGQVATEFKITAFTGPGDAWVWAGIDDSHLTSGGHKLAVGEAISQPFPSHTHSNWAFSEPGAYEFTVEAEVSGNGNTASSAPQNYRFVVDPELSISGLADHYQSGEAIELSAESDPGLEGGSYEWFVQREGDAEPEPIEGQDGSQLSLEADDSLNGAQITAEFRGDGGQINPGVIASAQTDTITIDDHGDEPAPEHSLSIEGMHEHYHQGSDITLDAVADPELENGSYEWFVQRRDQDEPVQVEDLDEAQFIQTAEQALDDAQVSANLVDDGGEVLASADAVTIDVDDHGAPPHQEVTVKGTQEHYHTGDTATLTATVDPSSVLNRYEWQVQPAGESQWTAVEGENGSDYSFDVGEDLNGAQVRAVLTYDDGEEYVASEPIEIQIDDHDQEPTPPETELTIEGLESEYQVGDVASLTAVQDPQTDEDHWHWFIQREGDDGYSVIDGALTDTLEHTIAEGDDGAQIIARLYDHDHALIAESEAATLNVAGDSTPPEDDDDDEGRDDDNGGDDGNRDDDQGRDDDNGNGGSDDDNGNGGSDDGRDDDNGNGGSDDGKGDGDKLPRTGAEMTSAAAAAGLLLAIGTGAVLLARRRATAAE